MVADDIFEPDEWEIKVHDGDRIGLHFRSAIAHKPETRRVGLSQKDS